MKKLILSVPLVVFTLFTVPTFAASLGEMNDHDRAEKQSTERKTTKGANERCPMDEEMAAHDVPECEICAKECAAAKESHAG